MLSNILRAVFLLILCYPGSTLLAADRACKYDSEQPATYDIGFFANHKASPYRDWDADESIIVPAISIESGRFYIKGAGIGYVLSDCKTIDGGFQLDLTGTVGLAGYDDSDSDFLEGMDDRSDITFAIGLKGNVDTAYGDFSVKLGHDVTDKHNGLTGQFRYHLGWRSQNNRLMLIPAIGLNYSDDNYNDYYYGVDTSETRPSRAAYEAKASVNPVIEVTALYLFSRTSSGYLNLSHEGLDDEIADSPIISEDGITALSFGYSYRLP